MAKYRFSFIKFGKIHIFFHKILQNTDFFLEIRKGFLYLSFSHTDFFPKILIFPFIRTDFVLDQSGRSYQSGSSLKSPIQLRRDRERMEQYRILSAEKIWQENSIRQCHRAETVNWICKAVIVVFCGRNGKFAAAKFAPFRNLLQILLLFMKNLSFHHFKTEVVFSLNNSAIGPTSILSIYM